jgi:hypothetical protein
MGERDLASIQTFVTATLRRPSPLGAELAPEIESLVVPSVRGMTPVDRLEVYRDQFWIRHLHNLADDYPTLAWAIAPAGSEPTGATEAFAELAREFLRSSPPSTWDLQRLGAALPAFVARHPRWSTDATACDAASLDWAFMEIFDAQDAQPFDPRVLSSTPEDAWPHARVELNAALRLVPLRSPLLEVRDALKSGDAGGRPSRPAPSVTCAVVWRDAQCFPRSVAVEPAAFSLLQRLAQGEGLGAACESVAQHHVDANVEGSVGGWFQHWVERGWIGRVVLSD